MWKLGSRSISNFLKDTYLKVKSLEQEPGVRTLRAALNTASESWENGIRACWLLVTQLIQGWSFNHEEEQPTSHESDTGIGWKSIHELFFPVTNWKGNQGFTNQTGDAELMFRGKSWRTQGEFSFKETAHVHVEVGQMGTFRKN